MSHDQIAELLRQAAWYIGTGGALVPLIVAFVNSEHWPKQIKQIVMFIVALIVASVTYFAQNGWDFTNYAGMIAALTGVITAAQTSYKLLWKQGGITDSITMKVTAARSTNTKAMVPGDNSGGPQQ